MKILHVGLVLGLSYSLTLIAVTIIHHRRHNEDLINPNSISPVSLRSKLNPDAAAAITATSNTEQKQQRQPIQPKDGEPKIQLKKTHLKAKNNFAFVQLGGEGGGKRTLLNLNHNVAKKNVNKKYKRLDIGHRFPEYGSAEFDATCPWTKTSSDIGEKMSPAMRGATSTSAPSCTIIVRNSPGGNEGVSMWGSQITHGFIHAQQAGCKLLIDYDGNVQVDRVLLPADEVKHEWRVPPGFVCEERNRCYSLKLSGDSAFKFPFNIPGINRNLLQSIPNYRWAYSGSDIKFQMTRSKFAPLEKKLQGFHIEDGMSCALGTIFRFAPSAAEFEPRLFTEILPAIQDKQSLVLSLYIRTGRTDEVAKKEEAGEAQGGAADQEGIHGHQYEDIVDCARSLEQKHLADREAKFNRIVWLVISDGPQLKQHIAGMYGGKDVTEAARTVRRDVITTGARGIHTRPKRKPSTDEFAEAIIDWMLIGESDALVANPNLSFGFTGALRTNRPFYDANNHCGRRVMVLEE